MPSAREVTVRATHGSAGCEWLERPAAVGELHAEHAAHQDQRGRRHADHAERDRSWGRSSGGARPR